MNNESEEEYVAEYQATYGDIVKGAAKNASIKRDLLELKMDFKTMSYTVSDHRYYVNKNGRYLVERLTCFETFSPDRLDQFEFLTSHPTLIFARMYTKEVDIEKNLGRFLTRCFGVIRNQRRIKAKQAAAAKEALYKRRTFAMIKPDITRQGDLFIKILDDIKAAKFKILYAKEETLDFKDAEWLYGEHSEQPWYDAHIDFIMSGPVIILLIESEKDTTIEDFRALMGPTDKTKAEPHTLRAKYGGTILRENAIHGSDSPESARREIDYFMTKLRPSPNTKKLKEPATVGLDPGSVHEYSGSIHK